MLDNHPPLETWENEYYGSRDPRVRKSRVPVSEAAPLFHAGYDIGREKARFALMMIKQIATAPRLTDAVRLQGILAQANAALAEFKP